MSLATRHEAWLHAVPREQKPQPEEGSRLSTFKKSGDEPERPPVGLPYLLDVFFDVGPTRYAGMGAVPLDDRALQAWQMNEFRCLLLQPWEVRALIRFSKQWLEMTAKAEDPQCLSPWDDYGVSPEAQRRVADSLRAELSGMAS